MPTFADVAGVIQNNLGILQKPGILAVRPGYRLEAGWPVGDPVIVALVAAKKGDAAAHGLPAQISGIPVEVREASSLERLKATRTEMFQELQSRTRVEQHLPDFPAEHAFAPQPAAAARRPTKTQIQYSPPGVPLAPVTDTFTVICHASPDAGWPTLKDFFGRIQGKLTVGIYDFTSAHILTALDGALVNQGQPLPLSLVLDHPTRNPTADQTDDQTEQNLATTLGNSMTFAWAPVRSSPEVSEWMFPTAYHIKVAVRDSAELWLSSGNWNNSNQPEDAPATDPDQAHAAETFKASDRDWHVIIPHQGLAQLFEAYLLNDRATAEPAQGRAAASMELEAFAEQTGDLADVNPAAIPMAPKQYFAPLTVTEPMKIQPLLTPDPAADGSPAMYAQQMLALISGARQTLYIQLQYIHPSTKEEDAPFSALLDAISARVAAGVDVRIILSQWQNSQWMERLQAAGIDTTLVRIQHGVHNKGFVVDHRYTVVSSQNWSGEGVMNNRDAGLIIDNGTVAKYFEGIFLHDWDNVAVAHPASRRGMAAFGLTAGPTVLGWEDDPGEATPPLVPVEPRPVPDLTIAPLALAIPNIVAPAPGPYDIATANFRYWSMAEAAARGAAFWRPLLPAGTNWQVGDTLPLLMDAGEDFNAYYDRQALNFFHGTTGGRTYYSGESPDIVCHEQGHAILDSIRPELFDAGTIEAAAFHEAWGDMSALLVALQLPSMRIAMLADTGGDLSRSSRLSRLAEQLGFAIRQISPAAVETDCLRNAANNFFYTNPETLPTNAPATALSSEPHNFSRVFTGAFLEALGGAVRQSATNPDESHVQAVSVDLAKLLIAAVLAAPVVPEYMSQVAAAIITADSAAGGKYGDVLKSAFVRRGILSPQSAAGIATFHAVGLTAAAQLAAPANRVDGELPHVALSASEYGLGEEPLLVRAPSDPRRFSATAAAYGVGSGTPSNSEHAARAFLEDLLQRGHIDIGDIGRSGARLVHPRMFKTHKLKRSPSGTMLTRILFDCGFRAT
jgi:hypothetical protein